MRCVVLFGFCPIDDPCYWISGCADLAVELCGVFPCGSLLIVIPSGEASAIPHGPSPVVQHGHVVVVTGAVDCDLNACVDAGGDLVTDVQDGFGVREDFGVRCRVWHHTIIYPWVCAAWW